MGTEIQTAVNEFRGTIDKLGDQFLQALPPQVSVDKFKRTLMTAISASPDLLSKDRRSLLGACMKAAADGLLLDGRDAALVSYGNQITYLPMIGGIQKKFRNSGECQSITTACVYATDEFSHWTDEDGEHLKHVPNYRGDRGEIDLAYALVTTKDGGVYIEVMSRAEIESVRKVSRAANNGPWVQWWGEMARKTVFRRLSKRLPMSTDLQGLVTADDEFEDVPTQRAPAPSRPTRLHSVGSAAPAHDQATGEVIEGEIVEPAQPEDDGGVF